MRSLTRLLCLPLLVGASVICTTGDARGLEKSPSHPDDLRCEYLINPLGIDVGNPRLSWKLPAEPAVRGQRQTAYQILVAASEATLRTDKGDLWDSGKIESDQSIHVVYAGKPLESRLRCWWKVRFWDKDGHPSDWSAPARWTMGMLKPADWTARWIGLDGADDPIALKPAQWIWFPGGNPAVGAPIGTRYFRHTVTLPKDRPIKKALCVITADDEFVLYVNGRNVGAGKNWSQAVDIDLSGLLHAGTNTLAVAATNNPSKTVGPDRNPAGLIGVLRVEFDKGEPLVIVTDQHWRCSDKRTTGWEEVGFADS